MVTSRHSVCLTNWGANSLAKVRLCLYGASSVHIVVTAYVTLTIDVRQDENPEVKVYWYVRWLLLTCWCNILILIYSLVSFYCEWREQRGGNSVKHVRTLKYCRDLLMTGILFPATMYVDTLFWLLWHKDPELIANAKVFEYLPNWAQHSLHSTSMVFVLLDVLLVPRERPTYMKLGLILMTVFFFTYSTIVLVFNMLGYPAYAFLRYMNNWFDLSLLVIVNYFLLLMCNALQWLLIDYRWKNYNKKENKDNR